MAGQAHKNLVWWKREMKKQSIYHYAAGQFYHDELFIASTKKSQNKKTQSKKHLP